jgi:hypothetical protein
VQNKRIEFTAGAHTANNLILFIFFPMELAKKNQFVWKVDWSSMGTSISLFIVFYILVRILLKNKEPNVSLD